VVKHSVHQVYAEEFLRQEFELKSFTSTRRLLVAVADQKVDFALAHPDVFEMYKEECTLLSAQSAPYRYKSHTGLIFSSDSEGWKRPVDAALEILAENGRLQS
jgi:hypothetical protein